LNAKNPKIKGYLITEGAVVTDNPKIVANNANTVRILANLQDADTINRNRRLYGYSTLELALKAPYIQERLSTKSLYGEAGRLPFIVEILCRNLLKCWKFLKPSCQY